MTRYLLDTNIISFLVKGRHPDLDRHIRTIARQSLTTSAICEAELRLGLQRFSTHATTRVFTEDFLRSIHIAAWDSQCADTFASMAALQKSIGKPLAAFDSLIAAHALALDAVLVTNDAAFLHIEHLRVEDWTKGTLPA